MELNQKLIQSLQTGFIDKFLYSNNEYLPQLIVNDKLAGKKVLTTIESEIKKCDEFWFSVAFITTSGIATLINTLEEFENGGRKGKILVSQYLNFTQPEALKRLLQFKNIKLKIAISGDFHSKGYLFKHGELYNLIVGSSNLTATALCSNIEWNLKISAKANSSIIANAIEEFGNEFNNAIDVTSEYISKYELLYNKQKQNRTKFDEETEIDVSISPNSMQKEALDNIKHLREKGKTKALLISATGTGKTYLSAFDAKAANPKKLLFIVHRLTIAKSAMKTFKNVFGMTKSLGLYSGNYKELENDFIFSTIQTISKDEHLKQFESSEFDYIVIDETHRAGAESYSKILTHFKPKFLLGMTATPERTDGLDIFKLFDHNIAYEIRLQRALEENMLCPFHYFGIADIVVNGVVLNEKSDFKLLTSPERIKHIVHKAKFYGCDDGNVRGLIFCSRIDECKILSEEFNKLGFKTIALVGENSEEQRGEAINRLESDDPKEKIDYIFTVDIFNEGVDIPKVNQIILLRPTQSSIVFVQQLGRGLRKIKNKEYLTVIDFIGNYNNNYLVPIALYGDTSYNKDSLRKLVASGSSLIPGTSTINFDEISRSRIFEAINSAKMQLKKDLVNDYKLLKYKLGHNPMMIDFIDHGTRDPYLYVDYSKSYFNFVCNQEDNFLGKLNIQEVKLLELFSSEINNSKRIEESLILKELIMHENIQISKIKKEVLEKYMYSVSDETINSCIENLNFNFVTENKGGELRSVNEIYKTDIVQKNGDDLEIVGSFKNLLKNETFFNFLVDNIAYSIRAFENLYRSNKFIDGFVLYRKYSRKDVFRILNWKRNPVAQNVGGYIISSDNSNCPIFVNYHKEESISNTTKYEDGFINNREFEWMSKSRRTLNSSDVQAIINYKKLEMRLPLFIKKNNDEGTDFYFMGDLEPIADSFVETKMLDNNVGKVSVVKMRFSLKQPVEDNLYNYITKADIL